MVNNNKTAAADVDLLPNNNIILCGSPGCCFTSLEYNYWSCFYLKFETQDVSHLSETSSGKRVRVSIKIKRFEPPETHCQQLNWTLSKSQPAHRRISEHIIILQAESTLYLKVVLEE